MRSPKVFAWLLALSMVALLITGQEASAGAKRRIAILPFEYGAVQSSVGTLDVGKGITTLLITRLVQDGTYSVVDREMLDQVLKEQNLSVSDRADPATACKIGKILSVDAIVTGTVTQFGVEKSTSSVSIPAVSVPYVGLGSLGTLRSSKAKAKVAIDARLIDINTTEILATAHGEGESKSKGKWGLNEYWDFSSSDFASSVAGEATIAACDAVSGQLVAAAAKVPDNQSLAAANVHGKIADVTGNTVIVNVGKANGLAVGDSLQVERPYKTIKDPETGKVLKELSATIGVLTLTQVDPDSATGTIVRGDGLKVGDSVRKVSTSVEAIVLTPLPSSSSAATTGGGTKQPGPASKPQSAGSVKAK